MSVLLAVVFQTFAVFISYPLAAFVASLGIVAVVQLFLERKPHGAA